jgi:hypothetical protein
LIGIPAEHKLPTIMTTSLRVSRALAVILGIVTPALETLRRWRELSEMTVWWPSFLDDYLIGAFLLFGAWRAGDRDVSGRAVLAGAWAFLCGMAYGSFFGQLRELSQPDPSGQSPVLVVAIKGIGLAVGITCLYLSLRPVPQHASVSGSPRPRE